MEKRSITQSVKLKVYTTDDNAYPIGSDMDSFLFSLSRSLTALSLSLLSLLTLIFLKLP